MTNQPKGNTKDAGAEREKSNGGRAQNPTRPTLKVGNAERNADTRPKATRGNSQALKVIRDFDSLHFQFAEY